MVLARALAFIEFADLTSGIKVPAFELARRLTERCNFQQFPKTAKDFDIAGNGIVFEDGLMIDVPIIKFTVWNAALVVDTRVHTSASRAVIEDILTWGAKELGLNYVSGSIKRFAFVSDVSFFTDVPILDVSPSVRGLANRCSEEVSKIWQEPVKYEPLTVRVGHDPTARKNGIAPFMIEHRGESRFSENKYYSEAPLPTDTHWRLLEEFEKDMLIATKGGNT
ncbi:MAG: hypothetical protein WB974_00025 [Acidobacteriaceae bacterium]